MGVRTWIVKYIDWSFPFTLYNRWFFSEAQAKAWVNRQRGLMWSQVSHG